MMTVRYSVAVAAGLCLLAVTAAAGQTRGAVQPMCVSSQLRPAFGERVSEATGQGTLIIHAKSAHVYETERGYLRDVLEGHH